MMTLKCFLYSYIKAYAATDRTPYLIMLLEYFSEAGKVERLVVLQQNQTEVELTECKLDVMHRLVHGFVDAALHRQLSNVTSSQTPVSSNIHRLRNRPTEI